jgi:hypothetical protein
MTTSKDNFIDKLFGGMESIVGGLEKSKEMADPLPPEEDDEHDKIINAKSSNPKLIWGVDSEVSTHHLFSDFTTSALCGRFFDASQLSNRKTEIGDGNFKCCGGCLRILQSRYERG